MTTLVIHSFFMSCSSIYPLFGGFIALFDLFHSIRCANMWLRMHMPDIWWVIDEQHHWCQQLTSFVSSFVCACVLCVSSEIEEGLCVSSEMEEGRCVDWTSEHILYLPKELWYYFNLCFAFSVHCSPLFDAGVVMMNMIRHGAFEKKDDENDDDNEGLSCEQWLRS